MRPIKLAGLNIDATVGKLEGNFQKLLAAATAAAKDGATICAAPEMVLSGYPAEDLVHWHGFVDQQWAYLHRFASETATRETIFVVGLAVLHDDAVYNSAAVVYHGKVLGVVPKEKLPTYNVFYDGRTFSRGAPGMRGEIHGVPFGDLTFKFPFGELAVEVCEDIWSPDGPMERRAYAGADIIVNISASPWRAGVMGTRREMLATRSADNYATLMYVNAVGGMDALVFDGGGFVFQNGQKLLEVPLAKRFREGTFTQVIDLDRTRLARSANTTRRLDAESHHAPNNPRPHVIVSDGPKGDPALEYPTPSAKSFLIPTQDAVPSPRDEYFAELVEAMVLGFGGYFEKTGVFENALIALSGGRDSALTLLLVHLYAMRKFAHLEADAQKAAVKKFIRCVSMPSRFNSQTTKSIAHDLCEDLGVTFEERSIEEAFERELAELRVQLGGAEPNAVSVQNIMPRIRMTRMQNLANANKSLLLHCGNMTEKAMGYGTIGGDFTAGAYSLLGNLPKTVVRALIAHLHETIYPVPSLDALIASEESAELANDQRDEDDLGLIEVLDACIHLFYAEKHMPHEVYAIVRKMWTDEELFARYPGYKKGMLKSWVKRFVRSSYNATFKWVVSPLATHLGSLDLDRERALQIPVVKSMEWLEPSLKQIDAMPN